jgi:amino acid adenylation domain-containing protein
MLVQDYFARSRALFPRKTAITYRDVRYTYDEVGAFADCLTTILTERGYVGTRVGFWMRRTPDAVATILGVLGSGSAYIPLDPDSPCSRLAAIVNDCEIRALVLDPEKAKELPELLLLTKGVELIVLTRPAPMMDGSMEVAVISEYLGSQVRIPERVTDAELAYIFYTSGSTGVPKGVMISHLNVVNFVDWAREFFAIVPEDHLANPTPLFFDLSTFDLHVTFAAGATLHMISEAELLSPKSIINWTNKNRITVWFSVPSVLTYLNRMKVLRRDLFPHLRAILWCGEPLPAKDLADWMTVLPGKVYANLYGPTETTVASTVEVFDQPPADLSRPISVGKPCDNTKILIVDESGKIVPDGELGELCIGGNSVMKGYWRRSDKNAEVLFQNPSHNDYPDIFYKTGDLAFLNAAGKLELKGRKDHQVKSRGYRIELGEIEAAVLSHPRVNAACVVAYPTEEFANLNIKLYYSCDQSELSEADLRQHLSSRIPRYMLPQKMERLEAMPRLPNGKIDRNSCKAKAY